MCNRLNAYISSAYAIFTKFGLRVDPLLATGIPGARTGLTQDGVVGKRERKKSLFSGAGKTFNLNISCGCSRIAAKPGGILGIMGIAKHT